MNTYDPLLDPTGSLAQQWGPTSAAAEGGDQRYFPVPLSGSTRSRSTRAARRSDRTIRRAAALALDRSALATAFGEAPTSQLLLRTNPVIDAEGTPTRSMEAISRRLER